VASSGYVDTFDFTVSKDVMINGDVLDMNLIIADYKYMSQTHKHFKLAMSLSDSVLAFHPNM